MTTVLNSRVDGDVSQSYIDLALRLWKIRLLVLCVLATR